jgi:hypothetical protein
MIVRSDFDTYEFQMATETSKPLYFPSAEDALRWLQRNWPRENGSRVTPTGASTSKIPGLVGWIAGKRFADARAIGGPALFAPRAGVPQGPSDNRSTEEEAG